MAERVWQVTGYTIKKLLEQNQDYEFILTGHSLGAGTACLLNIMCHQNGRELVNGRMVRCFAYAAPPVYTPIEFVAGAADNCVSFIHEHDVVPFLSVDSVRHFFGSIRVIQDFMRDKSLRERMAYVTGFADVDDDLVRSVERASKQRLPPKKGAPLLVIPASTILWLRDVDGSGTHNLKLCDPMKLARLGICIDPNMIQDHLPNRYEHALYHLKGTSE